MSAEFYAVDCDHPKKVSLEIKKTNAESAQSVRQLHQTLTKTCPRINEAVPFDVELNFGVVIATTCTFTQCPHHASHRGSTS